MIDANPHGELLTKLGPTQAARLIDGVPIPNGRADVDRAVTGVMLAARRAGVGWLPVRAAMRDRERHELAVLASTGADGVILSERSTDRWLAARWKRAGELVDRDPAWTPAAVSAWLACLRAAVEHDATLRPEQRQLVDAVLTLAEHHGTTRVATPVRQLATLLGLPETRISTISDRLGSLARAGRWLRLVERGRRGAAATGRASLYDVGPRVTGPCGADGPGYFVHRWGASHLRTGCHLCTAHLCTDQPGVDVLAAEPGPVTISGAPADVAAMLAALALARQQLPAAVDDPSDAEPADVVELDSRRARRSSS